MFKAYVAESGFLTERNGACRLHAPLMILAWDHGTIGRRWSRFWGWGRTWLDGGSWDELLRRLGGLRSIAHGFAGGLGGLLGLFLGFFSEFSGFFADLCGIRAHVFLHGLSVIAGRE